MKLISKAFRRARVIT